MDTLANALNSIKVSETKGLQLAQVKPASKTIREVLTLLQSEGFIASFDFIDDGKSGIFQVKLLGKINNCGVIKPRFPVNAKTWEKFEQRFLPAKNVGLLIVSTSKGLKTHVMAKNENVGGRLLCYVY